MRQRDAAAKIPCLHACMNRNLKDMTAHLIRRLKQPKAGEESIG